MHLVANSLSPTLLAAQLQATQLRAAQLPAAQPAQLLCLAGVTRFIYFLSQLPEASAGAGGSRKQP